MTDDGKLSTATLVVRGQTLLVRQFAVTVVEGPDRDKRVVSTTDEVSIGTADGNDLTLADPSVSRHHCRLRVDERGLELADLGSRNGTRTGSIEVIRGYVQSGTRVKLGQTVLSIDLLDDRLEQPIATGDAFGAVVGASPAMRRLYPLLERCAAADATITVVGETGTGKEMIAEAIHAASARRDGPFAVVDCSALSHDLAESELFGHEAGAFTGADRARAGAFEAARGGTIFLDQVGEMPLALQPLLLRVLENRTVRRVGANAHHAIDVRVIASSQRDLRELVNTKRFRADLYYRLHVLRVALPPLRERAGDVAILAAHAWREHRADDIPDALLAQLAAQSWPGNVRELRNAVERAARVGWTPQRVPAARDELSYGDARDRVVAAWEKTWIEDLLAAHHGNLSAAARAARMGRTNLREIARRHGIRDGEPED